MFNIVLTDKMMAHPGNLTTEKKPLKKKQEVITVTQVSAHENLDSKNAFNNKGHEKCLVFIKINSLLENLVWKKVGCSFLVRSKRAEEDVVYEFFFFK